MKPRIYTGRLFHSRLHPIHHAFTYPCMMIYLDIEDITQTANQYRTFGYNCLRLCSIYDADFLEKTSLSLKEKLAKHLTRAGLHIETFSSITLLTTPRVLGLGFNPLTLFCCFDINGDLHSVVADVHNTYGENRVYVLNGNKDRCNTGVLRFQFPKTLFVSPFNGVEGHYDLQFRRFTAQQIKIRLDLRVKNKTLIQTGFSTLGMPLTETRLITTLLRYPLTAAMALPRIAYQALVLRYIKKLQPRMKPKTRDETAKNNHPPPENNG